MNYNSYPLLYSRSSGKDYRWLLVPPFCSQSDLLLLNQIYDSFDDYKESAEIERSDLPVIFYIHLSNSSVIARCGKTKFNDKDGRAIYALEGLAVHETESRNFWYSLPFLITNHQKYLDSWQYINFDLADEVSRDEAKSHKIRLSELETGASKIFESITKNKLPKLGNEQIKLSYDKNGFIELLRYLMSPKVPALNFAFGFSNDLLLKVNDFQIIASIKISSRKNISTSLTRRENADVEERKAVFEKEEFKPYKESIRPRIEFCNVHLTSCMVREFLGLFGSERLCFKANIDSETYSRTIASIPMSYPANQLDLLKKGPTFEAQKALDNLRAELKAKGWKEVNIQKENWWEGRFQRQSDTNLRRKY